MCSRVAFVETVEHDADGLDMHEWTSAADALDRAGFTVVRFTADQMASAGASSRLGLDPSSPVIGSRSSMRHSLVACGVIGVDAPLPERPDYPSCLASHLGRKIEPGTLQDALDACDFSRATFVKPRGPQHTKLFTGVVLDNDGAAFLDRVPRDTPVWMSEVLEGLVSEWRYYVLHRKWPLISGEHGYLLLVCVR